MDKHCRICHNTSCSNHGKNISFLGEGWKCNYIPVPTNAGRIRAMSDEELVLFLDGFSGRCLDCAEDAKIKAVRFTKRGVIAGHETSWSGYRSHRKENKL